MRRFCERAAAALAWLGAAHAASAGTALGFVDPQGPVAAAQREHFLFVVAVLMFVLVPIVGATIFLLLRYRYGRKGGAYRPDWTFSPFWEVVIWIGPVVIVVGLSVLLWFETQRLDPYRPIQGAGAPLEVEVVAYDWKWLFIYPDLGIATVNELALPAGRQVAFRLTSETVMQSFFIPALGSQIYAMPRMVTQLHLATFRPGEMTGRNAQYNGEEFHDQTFRVDILDGGTFKDWVAGVRAAERPLDPRALTALGARGSAQDAAEALGLASPGELRFSTVPDGTFARLATADMPSGPSALRPDAGTLSPGGEGDAK